MEPPVLVKPIPAQIVNERAAFSPFDLKEFIQTTSGPSTLRFQAETSSKEALPTGMICTSDGILTGIPAKGTEGLYEIIITAENEGGKVETRFILTIKPSLLAASDDYLNKLKSQVWQALDQHLPVPDLAELINRPVTPYDVYYLLERWGVITAWDAFNLEPPGEKILLNIEGANPHYNIYDRGSCIVGCPKDLFSRDRTLADGIQAAQLVAREAYNRGWTIELVGFDRLIRAAWVELQVLGDKMGRHAEVLNFTPSLDDIKLYNSKDFERRGIGND